MSDLSKEHIDANKMYRLSDVERLTGHDARKLRRWADAGVLPGARREGLLPKSPYVVPGVTVLELIKGKE